MHLHKSSGTCSILLPKERASQIRKLDTNTGEKFLYSTKNLNIQGQEKRNMNDSLLCWAPWCLVPTKEGSLRTATFGRIGITWCGVSTEPCPILVLFFTGTPRPLLILERRAQVHGLRKIQKYSGGLGGGTVTQVWMLRKLLICFVSVTAEPDPTHASHNSAVISFSCRSIG